MRTLLALILFAVAVPARADVFTIALPGLLGHYSSQSGFKNTSFDLPGPPAVVRGAKLHVVGTAEIGTLHCGANGELVYPWRSHTLGEMLDGPSKYWVAEATNPDTAGAFDTITAFEGTTGSTWNFLSDGHADITLYPGSDIVLLGGCTTSWPPPEFDVTGAWIQVDADIPTPAATKSWGAVKAIYR